MSQTDVEKIKERLGIKEVIESYIKLEKAGKSYKGRCPFHNEKTPSFFVSPERESYYCFGCGEKGDIFTFVEKFEGTDFYGSLKILADRAGIKLSENNNEQESETKKQKQIMDLASVFFESNLSKNKKAIEYLKNRGVTEKTIVDWRIGFAPEGWQNLVEFFSQKKINNSLVEKVGLIKKAEKGRIYDVFRSRIMFPICNSVGEVIAFSGRIFGEEQKESAKYINSPETDLFKKSETLFGFHKAKSSIRKHDFSILVEGQMDTIMCHQAGYTNTVASSGTALTEKQLQMIYRISPKMVIAYDSDSAGFKAAERAWQLALSIGMDVKIADIKGGKDPADIIKEDVNKWKTIVKNSKHIVEVIVDKILSQNNTEIEIAKNVKSSLIPYLAMIKSKIDQSQFVKFVSDKTLIKESAIYSDLESYIAEKAKEENLSKPASTYQVNSIVKNNQKDTNQKDYYTIEKRLFAIVEWQKSSAEKFVDHEGLQKDIISIIGPDYDEIKKNISEYLSELIFTVNKIYQSENSLKKDVAELIDNLTLKYLLKNREKLFLQIKMKEKNVNKTEKDDVDINSLLIEVSKISKKIEELSHKKSI